MVAVAVATSWSLRPSSLLDGCWPSTKFAPADGGEGGEGTVGPVVDACTMMMMVGCSS